MNFNALPVQAFTLTGKIVAVELEGGFLGIETAQGERFKPLNLPVFLQEAGLHLQAEAELAPDMMGFHQWGQYIRLIRAEVLPCR